MTIWQVQLFNGLILLDASGRQTRRFRSHKVGALLAYLALNLGRSCPREELYEALWPEEDTSRVANRFRVTLASLRRHLEPEGVAFGTVLDVSEPGRVRLRPETVACDAAECSRLLRAGHREQAAGLLIGPLLPGFYEEWAVTEQVRYEMLREEFSEKDLENQGRSALGGASPAPPGTGPLLRPEAEAADLLAAPSPPTSPASYPAAPSGVPCLPLYLTRFFGREGECQRLRELMETHRQVSLIGMGGMGKTRLSVEVAAEWESDCCFVSLVSLSDAERLYDAVLQAMGIAPQPDAPTDTQLLHILNRRGPFLLILDNAEHLNEAVGAMTLRLLAHVPGLRLLVTSRQRLDIAGEAVYPLTPLEVPQVSPVPAQTGQLLEFAAVSLFVDRAKNARPDFALMERNAPAVAAICLLAEGIPLALELAAARIVMQTPAQIAEGMASGLLRLKSQQRGLSARHHSLRACIQGSYDLLAPEMQPFFARLSIFQGGWTVEAARFVTDCPDTEAFLEDLMRRSLLVIEEDEATGVMRCRFLEAIRQFAAELLTDGEQEYLALRHAEYFLTLAAEVTEDDIRTLFPLDTEQKNLLTALETGWIKQMAVFPAGLIGALYYAYIRGHNRVFLEWVERALTIWQTLPDIRERARLGVALYLILGYVGRNELVHSIGEEMLRDARAQDFPAGSVLAKLILSYAARQSEDYQTLLRLSQEALGEARQVSETALLYRALRLVAWHWLECAVNDSHLEAGTRQELLARCKDLGEECLRLLPADSTQVAFTRSILSRVHFVLGDEKAGYAYLKSAQQTALAHGMQTMLIFCCQTESKVAMEEGYYEYAALLHGAFRALREKTGYMTMDVDPIHRAMQNTLVEHLGEARYEALARQGEQIPHTEIVAMSLNDFSFSAL